MEYLKLGMVLAIILSPIVVCYWVTMDEGAEELTSWWNGESYDGGCIPVEILMSILIGALTFSLITVIYPAIIGGAIIAMIVVSLRNKRVEAIEKQK
tara:strand:- start:1084 stop:1374 length:291 start_codon:yes stop_codon:yes gene_type:complete